MKALTTPQDLLSLRLHQCHKHRPHISHKFRSQILRLLESSIPEVQFFLAAFYQQLALLLSPIIACMYLLLRAIILLPLWEQFHLDKVCKSQYCILNKSFSVQFWSCQSNLMERGRLLRALCSKYSVFGHQRNHSGESYVLILNQIGFLKNV